MKFGADFAQRYGPWAVVTGASSGIGAGFAEQLAAAGINVVLTARRKERLEALGLRLQEQYSVQTRVVVADLSDSLAAATHIADSVSDLEIGLLVNNAGVEQYGSFFHGELALHQRVVDVNVSAVVALTRIFGERLLARKTGGIIFISSMTARLVPYFATYSASKSFVSSFAQLIRYELKNAGVDVLCVEPGWVESEILDRATSYVDFESLGMSTIITAAHAAESSLNRLGKSAFHTPGFWARLTGFVRSFFPPAVMISLVGPRIKAALKPELFRMVKALK